MPDREEPRELARQGVLAGGTVELTEQRADVTGLRRRPPLKRGARHLGHKSVDDLGCPARKPAAEQTHGGRGHARRDALHDEAVDAERAGQRGFLRSRVVPSVRRGISLVLPQAVERAPWGRCVLSRRRVLVLRLSGGPRFGSTRLITLRLVFSVGLPPRVAPDHGAVLVAFPVSRKVALLGELTTERLSLSPIIADLGPAFHAACGDSLPFRGEIHIHVSPLSSRGHR